MLVVALALKAKSGAWLMHQRPQGKHHAGLWEFPGGKVEPGETPEIALFREIKEELAIEVDPDDLTPIAFASAPADERVQPIVILLYTCAQWCGEIAPQEGGDAQWFELKEIRKLPKPPLDSALLEQLMQKHAS